jgi:hypothetical protein
MTPTLSVEPFQVSVTCDAETTVPCRLVGVVGAVVSGPADVRSTVFAPTASLPAASRDRTRKL